MLSKQHQPVEFELVKTWILVWIQPCWSRLRESQNAAIAYDKATQINQILDFAEILAAVAVVEYSRISFRNTIWFERSLLIRNIASFDASVDSQNGSIGVRSL
jgi:hypothetical protein